MEESNYIEEIRFLINILSYQLLNIEKSPVKIYLLEKNLSEKDAQWIFLTTPENEQLKEKILKFLTTKGKRYEKDIIYFKTIESITDSRYICRTGRKIETGWIFVAEEKKYTYKIFSQIVLHVLTDNVTDLLQLESVVGILTTYKETIVREMEAKEKLTSSETIKKICEDKLVKQYCSKLFDGDWLINNYVSLALKDRGLPETEKILQLSAMRYETRESMTRLYFGNQNKVKLNMAFDPKMVNSDVLNFKPENYRIIRKLMELAGVGYGVLIGNEDMKVYGIVDAKKYKTSDSCIEINGYLRWSLKVGSEKIFEYSNGTYNLQKEKDEREIDNKFIRLKMFLKEKKWCDYEKIEELLKCLEEIKNTATHGTSIVFLESKLLEEKINGLSEHNKAYKIQKLKLLDAIKISGLTAIDGAIMVDLNCDCMGIGAILDGKSLIAGNAGRGARYNSVKNYVRVIAEENISNKCFAAVFSEDKTVDFIYVDEKEPKKKITII